MTTPKEGKKRLESERRDIQRRHVCQNTHERIL
jgi:hypothetical protein